MASWTDKQPPVFNPYVQQLPVEAMVEVGMEKQRRYDEGVQRIQTQIDNIAGLDIVRDVDKAYLQSKLSQLGGNLKTVAAGDFSSAQFVNSIGGMVGKIGKDENIQNAILSTRNYKKAREEQNLLNKEGKGSPSNDWEFNDNVNKWINGDIKSSFNSTYNPYTNYKKNALEVIKGLTNDETITDDATDISIGVKRNKLLQQAKGEYIAFIDDDDRIADNYIELIMAGIATNPDCCSLNGIITTNGQNPQEFKHSIAYDSMYERDGVLYRPPNHLNAVRSSIAKQMVFPDWQRSEDSNYCFQLRDSGLLKVEYKIEPVLYYYDFVSDKRY